MFRLTKLKQKIEATEMKKSLLYSKNIYLNKCLGKAKICKKKLYYYLIY